ncbi:MAG: glycosyltransferase family 2 protein [Minisyncoccia bacterium]
MNSPLVSIITPSFNRANFIESNIKSLINQTYKNFEHIVIDGGSTDGTIEILKKYENVYNLRWISEPDNGMYDAINKGIKMAKGEIISYLNTDDLYFPWTLETIVKAFSKTSSDIIFGDCIINKRENFRIYLQPPNFNYKRLACYDGLSLPQPSVFIRKKVFDKIGLFDTNFKLFGDIEFWIRCAVNGIEFTKINEILSIVIIHNSNLHINRDIGFQEKEKIRRVYCKEQKEKIYRKVIKYLDQIYQRYELIKFVISKADWLNFKTFIGHISYFKLILIELLPNRYKYNVNLNSMDTHKIFNIIRGDS